MPGVLPNINRKAVDLTIMTGLALNCMIASEAKFDRKNYHYPDLMKGYQISEYDLPICVNGWLEIEVDGETKRIGITRVHLEEDTARLQHQVDPATGETYSLVDVNRSGVPLMEIVSEPDIRNAEEARAYLQKLRQVLRYIGASRANMEEGNMRCEPNVSIRLPGAGEFGNKVELKNINSFKHAYDAIKFEEVRQAEVLDSGGRISQETRGWRDDTNQTVSQRSKEFAQDYRYFRTRPASAADQPLPGSTDPPDHAGTADAKRARFAEQYSLSSTTLGARQNAPAATSSRRPSQRWVVTPARQGSGQLGQRRLRTPPQRGRHRNPDSQVTPASLAALIALRQGHGFRKTAKDVFEQMFNTGHHPEQIVEEQGLVQIDSTDEVATAVDLVIANNPKPVEDYRGGKEEAVKFSLDRSCVRQRAARAKSPSNSWNKSQMRSRSQLRWLVNT
jgi:aspartyl-tRNA(Asn)/glutamyl-tRNA(Gln) amidotransferase subunit B